MRVLDLFSGIGGFSLGLERAGMTTVAFCEYEDFPRRVLAKHWPNVPCYPDVRTLTKEQLAADGITADLICGGYPCQPFSHAGKRGGDEDDRHLWPEMFRLIDTIRPRWVLAENVAGHISMGLDDVLSDLEGAGYAWWTFVIPACAVDAKHRRDRVWIVANARHPEPPGRNQSEADDDRCGGTRIPQGRESASPCGDVADTVSERGRSRNPKGEHAIHAGKSPRNTRNNSRRMEGGFAECRLGGMVNGFSLWLDESEPRVITGQPNRAERLKSLGNAVVPQVVEQIGRAIMEAARNRNG